MALFIPETQQSESNNKNLITHALAGATPMRRTETVQGRDAKGVLALALVAEGESALQQVLVNDAGGGRGGKEFAERAAERIQAIARKAGDSETRTAVERQLEGSMAAFAVRHRDMVLRKHLQGCDEQLQQRRSDITMQLEVLADTAQNSPDASLREQAKAAAAVQAALLHRAERAMHSAKSRYGFGDESEGDAV